MTVEELIAKLNAMLSNGSIHQSSEITIYSPDIDSNMEIADFTTDLNTLYIEVDRKETVR